MIRFIALDLDQTLIGADLTVAPRVKVAIQNAQSAGLLLTIATGREARLAARFARELEFRSPIVCAQGGCIYDHVRDQTLYEERLQHRLIPVILNAAEKHRWNVHFETADQLFFPKESRHPEAIFELLRYSNWVRVGDLTRDMPEAPHKVIVTLEQVEHREEVAGQMRAELGEYLEVVVSHPHLIEALPKGVSKARGLDWLTGHLGIDRSETMAVGDSDADIPMLRWAAVGVAMGNGTPAVKAAATWLVPSLEEDGAAVAIERALEQFNLSRGGAPEDSGRG